MRYRAFRATVFGLLAVNATYFLLARTGAEALDAVSWLTLLVLFELEARGPAMSLGQRTAWLLQLIRLGAGIAIVFATVIYVYERQWADAINSALWIAVVVLLEAEVRWKDALVRYRTGFKAAAALLYCGLAVLAIVWLVREEWFDGYDAVLWLVAFATIENDVLRARSPGA
jgi:hypothetical protein